MTILTPNHIKGLKEHKYSCSTLSFLDNYVMKYYWNAVVEFVPLWVAPNLITLVGLIVNLITSIVLLWYSPTTEAEAPRWAYLACGIGLFVYQTLDAIDGKQARRTGTSSPLGELFDHGCDSVSMVFLSVAGGASMGVGPTSTLLAMTMLFNFIFFCAHWQTYVRGTMIFGVIDVTEAQVFVMLVHLISFFYGPGWWKNEILGVQYSTLVILSSLSGIVVMLFRTVQTITNHESNKGTVAGTSVISPGIPCALLLLCCYLPYAHSNSRLFENHAAIYIITFGFCFAKITNQMVIAHMSKTPFPLFDPVLLGPLFMTLNIVVFNSFIYETLILYGVLGFTICNLVVSSIAVCQELCQALGIMCFKITPNLAAGDKSH